MLVFGGLFAFLNAFAVGAASCLYYAQTFALQTGLLPKVSNQASHYVAGANMLANCWGPSIGAKAIKYRTAVLLGISCELVGVLVFGPREAVVYNGILTDWTVLKSSPGLTLYALMWAEMTLVTWQFLAIWKHILIPVYLGFGTISSSLSPILSLPCSAIGSCCTENAALAKRACKRQHHPTTSVGLQWPA